MPATKPNPPGGGTPDLGLLLAGPMAAQVTTLRLMAEASRAAAAYWPASWLVAASPFYWAPPLWVLALMSASTADPHGGIAGSVLTESPGGRSAPGEGPPGKGAA